MSTPTSLDLPDGVRRTTIHTGRGEFAALEALPVHGVCERERLLVPGFTGSKEDFLAVLDLLAAGGRPVFAIDMRGQYETPGGADPDAYSTSALGSDIVAVVRKIGARHLLGRSYGGLICREALLTGLAGGGLGSLTLMSSGPSALTGPRATELRSMLAALGVTNGTYRTRSSSRPGSSSSAGSPGAGCRQGGVPDGIVAFLREADVRQRPERAHRDGTAHAQRAGQDRRADPAAAHRCSSSTAKTTSPGRRGSRKSWPGGWPRAGCASRVRCTPLQWRPRRRRRAS